MRGGVRDLIVPGGGVGGGGLTNINVSAGTTSNNLSNLVFADSNGVTFGLNGSTITASVAPGGGGLTNIRVSAGTTSNLLSDLTFADANGISFGINASTITAQHNALTSQSNQAVSGSNGSFTFQTVTFGNLNGLSFYTSNGSLVGSYTVPSQSVQTLGIYASSQTVGQSSSSTYDARSLTIVGDGIISVGWSNSSLRLSATVPSQSNQTLGGYFVGNTVGESSSSTWDARTVSIRGDGIVSVGWSNSSWRISATQSNQAFSAAGGSSAFQTLSFSDNGYVSWTNNAGQIAVTDLRGSFFATSNTTQSSSGTINLDSVIFVGAGIASVGVSNGSIIVSVPSGAPSPVNFSAGTTSNDLGSVVFSNSNGVSFGLNGSTITASVAAATAPTLKSYANLAGLGGGTGSATFSPNSLLVAPMGFGIFPGNMSMATFYLPLSTSLTATASSSSNSFTFFVGFYTLNGSTLSLATSGSTTFGVVAATSNTALSHGIRYLTIHSSLFDAQPHFTQGHYWIGMMVRSSNFSIRGAYFYESGVGVGAQRSGTFGISTATNTSLIGAFPFAGAYATTTTAFPASIGTNELNRGTQGEFMFNFHMHASDMLGSF